MKPTDVMVVQFEDHLLHVHRLVEAALAAADPASVVRKHLRQDGRQLVIDDYSFELDAGRVFVVAIGKAAVPMALAAADILAEDLAAAVVVTKRSDRDWMSELSTSSSIHDLSRFKLLQGGHPVSDSESLQAAQAVKVMLSETTADDLVLCLISGGASAVFADPRLSLEEWQKLNQALLDSGCTIGELNCVRRQLDRVKGGGLAHYAAPAACFGLLLSDVVGNPLEIIGSGPTALGQDTPADANNVLARYDIERKLGEGIWQHVQSALFQADDLAATAPNVLRNLVIGDVSRAAEATLIQAAQLGFLAQILTTKLEGEAREVGRVVAAIAKDLPPGRCMILGGETTVTVRGDGCGGRNQELALSVALALDGWPNTVIASFATDGEDGTTDAAGAVVTGYTASTGRSNDLDPLTFLENNDSFTFFSSLDEVMSTLEPFPSQNGSAEHLLRTGPTGTNVNDLVIILTYPEGNFHEEE